MKYVIALTLIAVALVIGATVQPVSAVRPTNPQPGQPKVEGGEGSTPTATPTRDPDLKPGFPVTTFGSSGGRYHAGPSLHVSVGNIDADAELEIVLPGVYSSPMYAWNHDGSRVSGWPLKHYYPGIGYQALGEFDPQIPGFEVFVGYTGATAAIFAGDGNFLPGWPIGTYEGQAHAPTAVDMDADGTDEVLYYDQGIWLVKADGSVMPGWPRGVPENSAAAADLDGDGVPEVVVASPIHSEGLSLFAYHRDGSMVEGFPVWFPSGYVDTFCAIGDVDADGELEIVLAVPDLETYTLSVKIVSSGGVVERTLQTTVSGGAGHAPALADLDGDGVPEIILDVNGALYVWYGDGSVFPGWPQTWNQWSNLAPVVGDIDGDGAPDIAVTHYTGTSGEGTVRAYNRNGQLLKGFPKPITVNGDETIAIADLDLDGRNELVVNGTRCCYEDNTVFVYDLKGPGPYGCIEWGQLGGGPKNQGVYKPDCSSHATPTALPTTEPAGCPDERFTDVCPSEYFYTAVLQLNDRGVVSGYNSSPPCLTPADVPCFRPYSNITRGQAAKLVALASQVSSTSSGQLFEDVAPGSPFYNEINALASRSYMGGYPCGGAGEPCGAGNRPYFRPGNSVTRGQLSKIVSNTAGFNEAVSDQTFEDVPADGAFYLWVERLAGRNIISGYTCGRPQEPCLEPTNRPYFRPNAQITRGQTAKIVYGVWPGEAATAKLNK